MLSVLNAIAKDTEQKAVNGILDLREIKNPDHFIIKLNGEWEFYWKKLLRPSDFKPGNINPDFMEMFHLIGQIIDRDQSKPKNSDMLHIG